MDAGGAPHDAQRPTIDDRRGARRSARDLRGRRRRDVCGPASIAPPRWLQSRVQKSGGRGTESLSLDLGTADRTVLEEASLQLADLILDDQATSKIPEPSQGVAGGSMLYAASSAPSKEAGAAWERRSPVAYTSERPAVQPMPTLKRRCQNTQVAWLVSLGPRSRRWRPCSSSWRQRSRPCSSGTTI